MCYHRNQEKLVATTSLKGEMVQAKTVKKCICRNGPSETIVRTEKNQAFSIMLVTGYGLAALAIILGLLENDPLSWGDPDNKENVIIVLGLISITLIAQGYFLIKYMRDGHSIKCAVRQAFFKVT